jgi:hypothetical protein
MISIDIYFEFLPHWAGPMIFNNFQKILNDFNINIINHYIYPNFISIKIDLEIIEPNNNGLDYEINYKKIIEKFYKNQDRQEIIDNNHQYQIEFFDDKYLLIESYNSLIKLIDTIVDKSLKYNHNYPKNIFWSNIGKYILPRPCTGYGFTYNNKKNIIKGHCFPIEKYFQLDWNNLKTFQEKKQDLLWQLECCKNNIFQWIRPFTEDDIIKIIYTYYNPKVIIGSFNDYNLPLEIIESCLTNHNEAFLVKNLILNKYQFIVFINGKNSIKNHQKDINDFQETFSEINILLQDNLKKSIVNHEQVEFINENTEYNIQDINLIKNFLDNPLVKIIKEYETTINIRLQETSYYYQQDQDKTLDYWLNNLRNIMFFENKISMENKRQTVKKIFKYLLNLIKDNNYNNLELIENLSYYLLDINSKIVEEFNDLHGFISSNLIVGNNYKPIVYDYFKKNYHNIYSSLLKISNDLFDVMMTLGLGGIMTPHKDPYNLKGTIDNIINLLIEKKITIKYQDVIDIFNQDYQEKFFWTNTINSIESRWLIKKNNEKFQENTENLGFYRWNNYNFYKKIQKLNNLKKRFSGLLKKNSGDEIYQQENLNNDDILLKNYIDNIDHIKDYENCYYWLCQHYDFFIDYLDKYKIKGNQYRENLINKLLEWSLYG